MNRSVTDRTQPHSDSVSVIVSYSLDSVIGFNTAGPYTAADSDSEQIPPSALIP